MLRLALCPPTWEMAVYIAAPVDIFGGDCFCFSWDLVLNCVNF